MTEATPETAPTTEAAPEPASTAPPAPPAKRSLEDSLATLDDDTRSFVLGELSKARREAGDSRAKAKQTAAEEARSELAQTIGKALGLVEDEKVDPAKLTDQIGQLSGSLKSTQVELAVFKAAKEANADASALLDSRSFLEKVADVDPADTASITAAISEAVASNARFGLPTPGMRPNPAQGASASPPPSAGERVTAAEREGDYRTAGRVKASQLLDLRDKTN